MWLDLNAPCNVASSNSEQVQDLFSLKLQASQKLRSQIAFQFFLYYIHYRTVSHHYAITYTQLFSFACIISSLTYATILSHKQCNYLSYITYQYSV